MDCFPVELWLKIAPLACLDGGYTARSLQLVSHQMRDIVKPVRFISVSLVTKTQLLAFSRFLPKGEQEARPSSLSIQHLLVDIKTHYWGDDAKDKENSLRLQEAVRNLLAVAALTLRTLALYGTQLDVVASGVTFPLVEDFCVESLDILGRNPILPSLLRLHLTRFSSYSGFWPLLARIAPALTHIRLSGLSQDAELPRILRNLLDQPVPDTPESCKALYLVPPYPPGTPEAEAADALASLRTVLVEPIECVGGGDCCGTGIVMQIHMKCWLDVVAEEYKQGTGRGMLYLLPDVVESQVSEARREWVEMVEGGSGPWATPEQRAARPPPPPAVVLKPTVTNRINSALRFAQNSLKSRMRGGK
ncbi:hypothetical protein PsYK624_158950 [Phanerochaete sordida]|uniref:Uncharacterized protein n=1 Tax=Phanerochaete sordida TaxID=48140 RepID=A0A9P3LME8_9APHY|nr:hypothetical protein PsYK624_158950 [Phanerochaete sordida]